MTSKRAGCAPRSSRKWRRSIKARRWSEKLTTAHQKGNIRAKRVKRSNKDPQSSWSAAAVEAASGEIDTDAVVAECPGLVEMAVNMANGNEELMDGTTAPVKAIIAQGEIVFAVWQEPARSCGIGLLLLKGDRALRETMAGTHPKTLRITGVKVDGYDMAVAANLNFGVHEKTN